MESTNILLVIMWGPADLLDRSEPLVRNYSMISTFFQIECAAIS